MGYCRPTIFDNFKVDIWFNISMGNLFGNWIRYRIIAHRRIWCLNHYDDSYRPILYTFPFQRNRFLFPRTQILIQISTAAGKKKKKNKKHRELLVICETNPAPDVEHKSIADPCPCPCPCPRPAIRIRLCYFSLQFMTFKNIS